VLCEKPLAGTVEEVHKIMEAQKKHDVFVMEAFWTRFFPAYDVLRKVFKSKKFGEVKSVLASYGTCTLVGFFNVFYICLTGQMFSQTTEPTQASRNAL
jgi:predicted dehydrogenase